MICCEIKVKLHTCIIYITTVKFCLIRYYKQVIMVHLQVANVEGCQDFHFGTYFGSDKDQHCLQRMLGKTQQVIISWQMSS